MTNIKEKEKIRLYREDHSPEALCDFPLCKMAIGGIHIVE